MEEAADDPQTAPAGAPLLMCTYQGLHGRMTGQLPEAVALDRLHSTLSHNVVERRRRATSPLSRTQALTTHTTRKYWRTVKTSSHDDARWMSLRRSLQMDGHRLTTIDSVGHVTQ